ncbi:hypothetical protein MMAGJ_39140 [Mycolicibacterium mageritense]|uniref:Uncharacterized protein n=2 Tax=Mycolicibacterium mageritense TaxID=53462 RepID=A0ABM7HVL0_MYCME|nr:hypothetical protein MMAGJ_39140 [Mycolicibacterium mageritense]CDO20850.1 hypothetical protein BN978_01308 [Mycolicibacterium mageritense DSM 44476 = CIP 104973]
MAPDIRQDSSLLDEATAIVEAEWIRLQQDWDRELADLLAETPAPRPRPPRVGTGVIARRHPGPPRAVSGRGYRPRRRPSVPVRATQRSPPAHPNRVPKHKVGTGR